MSTFRAQVLLCAGGSCISSGSESVRDAFHEELARQGLAAEIGVITTGCMGMCEVGPIAVIYPEGVFYQKVTAADAAEIVREHLLKGRVVQRLFYKKPSTDELIQAISDIDFFKLQKKIALRNCGSIDPEEIREYIAAGGYEALGRALTAMSPPQIIEEVKASGLRGRGGAGFPTGLKWSFTAAEPATPKYVVCNADEGDPGAFMDRSILEGDPHSVIEAMAICGYAIGAGQGYIYVRAEYPLAIQRLNRALTQARELGLLGADLFGSGFDFDIEIRMGAGAFVCGEETALMHSIEGRRGEPRPKPPFPAQKGLFGQPTVLNNVETFANITAIVLQGGAEFAKIGTDRSKGTKVFALAGDVNNTGLVEVPMGITLGTIVYDIGGGIPNRKRFKAVQIGGPSGGCIPAPYLNTPITYESLPELGAIMGSGGLVVMNEDTCMVDLARYFLEFIQEESCGKCTPCRVGTKIMLDLVTRICYGVGTMDDLRRLEELARQVGASSLCGLGQTAPNPVLSTLRYFRDEYIEHIRDRHCRAGVCNQLMWAPCTNACPAAVNVPAYLAYVKNLRFDEALRVHLRNNPFPSVCGRVCPQFCVAKCRRNDLEGPLAVRAVKRFMSDQREDYLDLFPAKAEPNGKRVAVIGAGPAGLTCGYYLVLLGYGVTVYEKQPEAGGMLRYAIPDYRLPRRVLANEIRNLERLGLKINTGVTVGRDVTLETLREQGVDGVYLATGAGHEVKPDIDGLELPGVRSGIEFLESVAKGEKAGVGREVLVVGGGDVAVDCARTARRCGAEDVRILYRRTREEMPTQPEEIEEAEREGVTVQFLVNPIAIRTAANGRLLVTVRRMRLGEFDRGGRRRPLPIETADAEVEVDTVILAVGQRPEAGAVLTGTDLAALLDGTRLKADARTGATAVPDVFAGGDLVNGPATVVEAIAAGQRAAKTMDMRLGPGRKQYFWEIMELPDTEVELDQDIVEIEPATPSLVPTAERGCGVEVEQSLGRCEAVMEAGRCLRCDYSEERCRQGAETV